MLRIYFLAFVLFFLNLVLFGQEPYSIKINRSKGLPSDNVYNIFQDSKGFIWIGNEEGLTRYDGYEMKTYECSGQTSRAGSMICEDIFGRIWYENFDGYLYYLQNDSLKALKQSKPLGYLGYGLINNRLFVGSQKGIDIYDLSTLKIIKTIPIDISTIVSCLCSNNHYYVISNYIFEIDENGNSNKILENGIGREYLLGNGLKGKSKVLFYDGYNRYKQAFTIQSNAFKEKFALPFKEFIQTAYFTDSCYWFCTPKGVYAYQENGTPLNNNQPFFKSSSISAVLRDREGNYWFGTTNDGILLVPELSVRVFSIESTADRLAINKNQLFVSTSNGKLFNLNLQTKTSTLYFNDGSNKQGGLLRYDSLSGMLFFMGNIFYVINEKGKCIAQSDIAVKSCYRIDSENIAFAASGVLGFFNLNGKVSKEWKNAYIPSQTIHGRTNLRPPIRDVHLMDGVRGKSVSYNKKTNTIYFATNTGLYACGLSGIKELKYNNESIYVSILVEFNNRQLFLDTHGHLFEITEANKIVESKINQQLGLNFCKSIKVVDHFLFLTTKKGLNYLDLSDNNARLCEVDISPAGEPISDVEIFNGDLILASGKGIITSKFKRNCEQNAKPLFIFNKVTANSKVLNQNELNNLDHNENNIEINYSILSFKSVQAINLYYQINNNAWEKLSPESRTLKLAALAPGEYKISFRLGESAANTTNYMQLSFFIHQPWWKTWWAISGFILLFLLCFVFVYNWQTSNLKKQNQLLQQKFELEKDLRTSKLKSIKAQMNPHFFYNALNTIQNFIFMDDKRNASTYLSKFSKLTRTILEMSEKENVSLAEELEALKLYLDIEKVRFSDDFNFTIKTQENINAELIKIPSMLIQPYIENAIKHGLLHKNGNKDLKIEFSLEGKLLLVSVDDNGIGRERSGEINRIKNKNHQSFATEANSRRLDLLNKGQSKIGVEYEDKIDQLGSSMGTKVIIRIPIS